MQETLREFLKHLLETGEVDGVFALRRTRQEGRYCYSLVSQPELVSEILPFYPVMPVQGARALSELTTTEPLRRPVAVLLRPCEIRAFVENVKQTRGDLENLMVISCTCPGVIPAAKLAGEGREEVLSRPEEHTRNACRICTEFIPGPYTDMTVLIASDTPTEGTSIYLHTEAARRLVAGFDAFEPISAQPLEDNTEELLKTRSGNLSVFLEETPSHGEGLESLVRLFSSCISCRGCREVCPVCHCIVCDYETSRTQHSPGLVRTEAMRRGAVRVPAGTLQFQLGRLNHISPTCVSCGQCSDACPVDIPVSDIFMRAAHMVQSTLKYRAGNNIDDSTPMSTFTENELQEITD